MPRLECWLLPMARPLSKVSTPLSIYAPIYLRPYLSTPLSIYFIYLSIFQRPGRERTALLRRLPLRALPAAARRGQQRRPEQQLLPADRPAARTATRRAEYARHDCDLAKTIILPLNIINTGIVRFKRLRNRRLPAGAAEEQRAQAHTKKRFNITQSRPLKRGSTSHTVRHSTHTQDNKPFRVHSAFGW